MVRLERTRNDDCRTLHVFDEVLRVACMLVHFGTVLENLIIIKLRCLKSTRAGPCIIQIIQQLELEPALLKINKRSGDHLLDTVWGVRTMKMKG